MSLSLLSLRRCFLPCLILFTAYPFGIAAEEIMTMESTITGSQEQPQVMSIVPWQAPVPSSGLYRPISRGAVENEILQPLDREVFKREVHYYDGLNSMVQQSESSTNE